MGLGFRKSVKIGKGVRLNVSKRGIGVSAGVKGFRVGTGPSGSRVRASVPGTGVYYEKRLGTKTNSKNKSSHVINQTNTGMNMSMTNEVPNYEKRIDTISNMHTIPVNTIDWVQLSNTATPFPENAIGPNEEQVLGKLKNFKPSMMDKLFSRTEARKKSIEDERLEAVKADTELFTDWQKSTQLAKKVLKKEQQALMDALVKFPPYQYHLALGSRVSAYTTTDNNVINIEFNVNSNVVIPDEIKTLTKTGKVSTRKMGVTRFNELLNLYVTGGAIAIAKETFAVLPVNNVFVHCIDAIINPSTGVKEDKVLLSAIFDKKQLDTIIYERIDPEETIKLFHHNMNFLKTKGFQPVERIEGD